MPTHRGSWVLGTGDDRTCSALGAAAPRSGRSARPLSPGRPVRPRGQPAVGGMFWFNLNTLSGS